ncbi:MAG: cytochrome P450 [Chitinophagaceae bacterium]|nr:cytochrome P450 [Chitinophagaceae bacterium]
MNSTRLVPPAIPRWRSLMDSKAMIKNPVAIFSKYAAEGKETFTFHFGGIQKAIVTSNPAIIQHVLKTNYENYHKSDIQVKRMAHFLGKGLLTSHGKEWLIKRRLIQQGFHKERLGKLVSIMQIDFAELMDDWDKEIDKGAVDIYQQMMRITFKMVTRSLFSITLPKNELTTISNSILTIQQFMVKQIVQPYLNPWFWVSGKLHHYEQIRNSSYDIIMKYIRRRRASNLGHDDMLQIFFDARYEHSDEGMDDDEILSESMQLLVAGHETSSNALSWTLYLLCRHPDAINAIRNEIDDVLGDGNFEFKHIEALTYTTQVIEESLRLYPPFWMVDREALSDDEVAGLDIPAGSTVIAFIHALHHSPLYWKDPEEFRPERFAPAEKKKHTPFTFMPFGAGPRGCIGGNFAMMQMLLILTNIIRNYDIKLVPDEAVEIEPMLILRPKGGIKIKFSKRNDLK